MGSWGAFGGFGGHRHTTGLPTFELALEQVSEHSFETLFRMRANLIFLYFQHWVLVTSSRVTIKLHSNPIKVPFLSYPLEF